MRKNLQNLIIPAMLFVSSLGYTAEQTKLITEIQTNSEPVTKVTVSQVKEANAEEDGDFIEEKRIVSRPSHERRHYQVNDAFYGHRHARPDYASEDNDWFDRCSKASRELIRARGIANRHAAHGRLGEASVVMKEAILRVADGDLSVDRPAPGPHLIFAAEEAKKIIETSDSALTSLPARLRIQVDYLVSNGLLKLLISAFDDLDDKYVRKMDRRCGDCWFDGLPDSYFDGVRSLAERFVDLQLKLQEVLASDIVELKMAKAISISATNFLEAYTHRRAYCRALNHLLDVRDAVCDYLDNPEYPSYELIPEIRRDMRVAKQNLSVSRRNCNDGDRD